MKKTKTEKKVSAKKSVETQECCKQSSETSFGGLWYIMGFVGALIYYISQSSSFVEILIAIGKSLVWPIFLIAALFSYIGA